MGGNTRPLLYGFLCATLVAACGGDDPPPNTQFQAGGQVPPGQQQPYPQQQQPYPQQQQPYPQQQPAPQPAPAQPGAPGAATGPIPGLPAIPGLPLPPNAPAGSPAQQLDASAGAAAQPIINNMAATEAPGAKPVGAAVVGMFQPGQQLESTLQLQPGKCYTIIAAGLPPVAEVNIQLVATSPIPGMSPVLAQDQATGANAVLGKAPNCYKWPFPLAGAAKVITSVAAGQGLTAVQVYEK